MFLKRLAALWTIVRGDAYRLWIALRHPDAPWWLKPGAALLVLYVLSPIDLLPDTIPLFGVLDDLVLVPLAIRWLLERLPPGVRAAAERGATRTGPSGV